LAAPATKFQIKNSATAGKDKLSWSWGKGDAFDQTALGTPNVAASTTYTLCIYDQVGLLWSVKDPIHIAPSTTLWTSKDPKGLQSKDEDGTSEGVTKVQLKTGAATKTNVKVSTGTMNLVLPTPGGSVYFDQNTNVVVQLVNSAGTCWTSSSCAIEYRRHNELDSCVDNRSRSSERGNELGSYLLAARVWVKANGPSLPSVDDLLYIQQRVLVGYRESPRQLREAWRFLRRSSDGLCGLGWSRLGRPRAFLGRSATKAPGRLSHGQGVADRLHHQEIER
jgi:hypothetical protein